MIATHRETSGKQILLIAHLDTVFSAHDVFQKFSLKRGGADISYIAKYVEASLDGLGPWGKGTHTQQETLVVDSLPLVTKQAALFLLEQIKNETISSLRNH